MLPNVSAIYRDLAAISNPQPPSPYPRSTYNAPQPSLFEQKQARHNQLMEKLRNAQQQSQQIHSQLSPNFPVSASTSYSPHYFQPDNNPPPFQSSISSDFFGNSRENRQGRGWQPPNIKYRHIEDFKQLEPSVRMYQEDANRNKMALEREFYEEKQRERGDQKPVNRVERVENVEKVQRQEIGVGSDNRSKQEKQIKMQESSESSYGKTWINRQSKFEDKLESYYEVCRKRPISSRPQPIQQPPSHSKFTRGTTKPNTMQLQKALRLLSFD